MFGLDIQEVLPSPLFSSLYVFAVFFPSSLQNFLFYCAISTVAAGMLLNAYPKVSARIYNDLVRRRWELMSGEQRASLEADMDKRSKDDACLKAVSIVNLVYLGGFTFLSFYLLPRSPVSVPFHIAYLMSTLIPSAATLFFL